MQDSANAEEYFLSSTSATYKPFVITDLATNAPHVADSIWGETQQIYWEGSNVDAFETRLGAIEATGTTRVWLADYNSASASPAVGGNVWLPISTGSASAVVPNLATAVWFGGNQIEWEGNTADTIETRLKARDPTGSDNEIWLPDLAGDITVIDATTKAVQIGSVVFSALPSSNNGTMVYCSDCTAGTPCTDSGTGLFAFREAGAWNCK
jgi:hypothetical protein